MKAAQVLATGAVDDVVVRDVDMPTPMAGEVLLQLAFAEVNYPDLLVIEGRYQTRHPLPFIPGTAAVGHIIAVGDGVDASRIGQRALAFVDRGAFAQFCTAPETACFAIPDGIDLANACGLGLAAQTAYFALFERAKMLQGESVLVLGAGGAVGSMAIQMARAAGAETVLAAWRKETSQGDAPDIDLAMTNLVDGLRSEVMRRTSNRGVDIVIDPLGGAAHAAAIRALAWRGRLVVIGFAGGDIPTIKANYLLVKNISVSGLQWTDYRDREPGMTAQAQAHIWSLCQTGALKSNIRMILPLSQTAQALRMVATRGAKGRILLAMS